MKLMTRVRLQIAWDSFFILYSLVILVYDLMVRSWFWAAWMCFFGALFTTRLRKTLTAYSQIRAMEREVQKQRGE